MQCWPATLRSSHSNGPADISVQKLVFAPAQVTMSCTPTAAPSRPPRSGVSPKLAPLRRPHRYIPRLEQRPSHRSALGGCSSPLNSVCSKGMAGAPHRRGAAAPSKMCCGCRVGNEPTTPLAPTCRLACRADQPAGKWRAAAASQGERSCLPDSVDTFNVYNINSSYSYFRVNLDGL